MARKPPKPPVAPPSRPQPSRTPAPPVVTKPAAPAKAPTAATPAATIPTKVPTPATPSAPPTATTPVKSSTTPAPVPAAASPALSLADVKLLRDRLDAVKPGVPVAGSTPTDQLLAAMAAKLDAARAEDRAKIAALETRLAGLTTQLADLTAKANDLAAQAATSGDDRDAELRDALAVTDRLLGELTRVRATGDTGAADLAKTKQSLDRSQREVADLRTAADPKATGAAVLGPETVAALLNDFVGSFKTRLTGLDVASGEVSLKAGFAQLGKGAGFVLPTAGTPASNLPILHEITLRLDTKA